MIVGLTGPNAAGKGEVARFLIERGFTYYSLSDVVREEATARGLDHSRENLILVGNELRAEFGPGVLAERIAERIEQKLVTRYEEKLEEHAWGEVQAKGAPGALGSPKGSIGGWVKQTAGERATPDTRKVTVVAIHLSEVVDSVRSPAEVAVLRRLTGFILLGVDAPIALRFERSQARGRMGDGATLEEFIRKEALENSSDPAAQQLVQTLALADVVIQNAGTLEDLRAHVAASLRLS